MTPETTVSGRIIDTDVSEPSIDIAAIIKRNLKKDSEPFPGTFSLLALPNRGNNPYSLLGEPDNSDNLYLDVNFGYVVQATAAEGTLVNVCTLGYETRPINWSETLRDNDPRIYPRIVQMQGCTKPDDGRTRRGIVMQALSSVSLEDICVDLAIELARRQGQPAVGILPASENPNSHRKKFSLERALIRYDGTAERRGFQRNSDGMYILELPRG